jgi:hypothetical protein
LKLANLKFNLWLWKYRTILRLKNWFSVSDETLLTLFFMFPLGCALFGLGILGWVIGQSLA